MTNKRCSKCREAKPVAKFSKRAATGDGLQPWCKSCAKVTSVAWARANPESVKVANAAWRVANLERYEVKKAARVASRYRFIDAAKITAGCADCGFDDSPSKLEFDHVRGEKSWWVSNGVGGGYSLSALLDEMEKCDVRCRSCHVARHAHARQAAIGEYA